MLLNNCKTISYVFAAFLISDFSFLIYEFQFAIYEFPFAISDTIHMGLLSL